MSCFHATPAQVTSNKTENTAQKRNKSVEETRCEVPWKDKNLNLKEAESEGKQNTSDNPALILNITYHL